MGNSTSAKSYWKNTVTGVIVNICRLTVSLTFILSGFVKAVDPLGTKYKIIDYAEALGVTEYFPDMAALLASVALAATEFMNCLTRAF